jgi:hypothetical protein
MADSLASKLSFSKSLEIVLKKSIKSAAAAATDKNIAAVGWK